MTQIRNIAIIAHVDHGKTTMVDQLLRQSGTFADHEKVVDTVMDNNAIERERGITILAKNCAVSWLARYWPLWRSIASTRVVLPWSTWAMMATLRRFMSELLCGRTMG
jgi:translation elongation factor EF-G